MEKALTFEEALSRLEAVVKDLESGKLTLEKALELFGEGVSLVQFCHRQLEQAQQKILLLAADAKGNPVLQEFSLPDLNT